MTSLSRELDKAIARSNREFLADQKAIEAAQRQGELGAAVYDIEQTFDKMREAFLSDPGGYLAQIDFPYEDEIAADAIAIVEKEWGA